MSACFFHRDRCTPTPRALPDLASLHSRAATHFLASALLCLPLTRTSRGTLCARRQDQGWSGHLGLQDYNIANLKAASFVPLPISH